MMAETAPVNVCGFVVHAKPERLATVTAAIRELPGVDIHGEAHEGRLIVTAIDTDETMALEQFSTIQNITGVVSTSLAFHQIDDGADDAAPLPSNATDISHFRRA